MNIRVLVALCLAFLCVPTASFAQKKADPSTPMLVRVLPKADKK